MTAPDTSRISPTAHYTAYVWVRNGMSYPAFATRTGRRLYRSLWPANAAYERVTGRPGLEPMLLARHRIIDHLLARAVEAGEVAQVIELAAGLSPRGARFASRYPGLRYVEADLPGMAARKRALLSVARLGGPAHRVVELNALAVDGPDSLDAVVDATLAPGQPTAIITEGLLSYFDTPTVEGMFGRFARCLAARGGGTYLSDLQLASDAKGMTTVRAFRRVLSAFARGTVHLHYRAASEATAALARAGFARAELIHPAEMTHQVRIPGRVPAQHIVRVIRAQV